MRVWAAGGKFPSTAFLCVCVDPNAFATAKEFSQLYFRSSPDSLINGYIDNQADFPNFQAQLGCQGFTVFNAAHQIVIPKSVPWMQFRDSAFRQLEGQLCQLLQPPAPENPLNAPVGQYVKVVNLTSAAGKEVNGQKGEVVGSSENGRFLVKLNGATKSFKPENLEDVIGAPIGKRVKVVGLTSEKGKQLNGQLGEVLGGVESGRYLVKLEKTTMALKDGNLEEVTEDDSCEGSLVSSLVSVGHEGMDAQHDLCLKAVNELVQKLSVQSLRHARKEVASHFEDEEKLLQDSELGKSGCGADGGNDFSALASHIADHKRIIDIFDDALLPLEGTCESSEGAVPKKIAADISKALVTHTTLYDSLYEGKIKESPTEAGEVNGAEPKGKAKAKGNASGGYAQDADAPVAAKADAIP